MDKGKLAILFIFKISKGSNFFRYEYYTSHFRKMENLNGYSSL